MDAIQQAHTELEIKTAELARALAEIERLTGLLDDPKLVELELEPGGSLRMGLEPCIGAKVLAASFADLLGDAKHWRSVEVGPMPSDQGVLIVTVRRATGQTPEETVGFLRARLDAQQAQCRALERELEGR